MVTSTGLTHLLRPITLDRFSKEYFEQDALLISGRTPASFPDILDLDEFERLLRTLEAPESGRWLTVVKNMDGPPTTPPMVDPSGGLIVPNLMKHYEAGYTILLNRLQRRSDTVRALCQSVANELSAATGVVIVGEISANAYLTPPMSQAFSAHYDDHDVFVLQIDGTKAWDVFPLYRTATYTSQANLPGNKLGEPLFSAVLSAGDVLYIPRRFPHRASTRTQHSLHLTLGLTTVTMRDIVDQLTRFDDRFWRSAILYGEGAVSAPIDSVADYLERLFESDRANLDTILERISTSMVPTSENTSKGLIAKSHAALATRHKALMADDGSQ